MLKFELCLQGTNKTFFHILNPNIFMATSYIPFGKYEGQSIDILFKDPTYLNWFLKETDIPTKYKELYNSIITELVKRITISEDYVARNTAIFKTLNSNLKEFISERLGHEIHGELSNLTFFSNNSPVTFDYINTAIDSFPTTSISVDFIHTIPSDIKSILDKFSSTPESNSKTVIITYNALATGIPVILLTGILQTHNILLWVLEQPETQPLSSGFGRRTNNQANSPSNSPRGDVPF